MKRALLAVLVIAIATPSGASPLTQDPLGPMTDVTAEWQHYQPSTDFCVALDGFDFYTAFSGNPGPTCSSGEFRVQIETPLLCNGCRRLFIDYSQIPANDPMAGLFYAHGHVYFRLRSANPSYTVDPLAHSPNIKNLTNDKAVAPSGSLQEHFTHGFDLHAMAYTGDTRFTHHSDVQGPYYVGPWYRNRDGVRIDGAYLDVEAPYDLGNVHLNGIGYQAGFNAGEATCPDEVLFDGAFADGNYFYGGCATHPGESSTMVDPFA